MIIVIDNQAEGVNNGVHIAWIGIVMSEVVRLEEKCSKLWGTRAEGRN